MGLMSTSLRVLAIRVSSSATCAAAEAQLTAVKKTLTTALTAAVAAFASTRPGGNRNWYWLPLVPLSAWLFTVGQACIDEWRLLGPAALSLRLDSGCLLPMILVGIVPTAAMIYMLRRGAPLSPRLSLALGMLATAALVNFGLRLFHLGDITFMVLVWHFGMLVVVTIFATIIAPSFLAWERLAARLPASIRKR